MPNSMILNEPVRDDPFGRTIAIALRREDFENVLRPGLLIVQQTMPSLEATARGIIAEVDDHKNPPAPAGYDSLIRINREVDEQLLNEGKLKVVDCDKEKILVLLAAFGYEGSKRARELAGTIAAALAKGGVPFRVEGEPELGGSIHVHIFDQSLELKFVRPA